MRMVRRGTKVAWRSMIEVDPDDYATASYLSDDDERPRDSLGQLHGYEPFVVTEDDFVSDWKRNLLSIPKSEILRDIAEQLGFNVISATLQSVLQWKFHIFPSDIAAPHELVGTALGLLLVFRTEKAYDRFWDGRQSWSDALGAAKNLSHMVGVHVSDDADADNIYRLLEVFPYCLRDHLRVSAEEEPIAQLLTSDEWKLYLGSQTNRPAVVLTLLSKAVRDADADYNFHTMGEQVVVDLFSVLTNCEKIVKTPVPVSYVRHTGRFVSVWTLTLPTILVSDYGFAAVPITAVVSWAMLSLKALAQKLERPFGPQKGSSRSQLPVDDFCRQVRMEVAEARRVREFIKEGGPVGSARVASRADNGSNAAESSSQTNRRRRHRRHRRQRDR